ncbi:glycoside hydrolase family 43 protein [Actinoplanes sp. TBRC 11911]|uniref:glycoside hydrolase family 43 protein n=1 Tax=Actinoplanes sp. TBRC 11911 TaxID=2729386 RepID=UPI00145FA06A|nr:glycoside hydrolase family 43 protein [Actinoplanes sp. TBRC 11911]NMO51908.1 glycoside hydrolase family 43 protein [Actinoplanes sp. TBRC 11911]
MSAETTATTSGTRDAGRAQIHNPVLPGFHPDPSILRVGTDYYIATSTFEWFPGVRLHHSTDLVTWRPLRGALTETRLLDLTGTGDSCGVWAPNLTYAHGQFHLLYTNVATFAGGYWDPQNYLVTAPRIDGPWSDPVVLHGRGFDASLFHDDDGTTWMLSMIADSRPGRDRFAGISIQQYDREARRLVGPERMIFQGTSAGMTEAPNLYRKDGWYLLVTAEGGTNWEHQVTVARSSTLHGPYLADPHGPLLSSYGNPELVLQKAGHGSLVSTPAGEWYLAHLVGRPYTTRGRCVLGRETALQEVHWTEDGWPRIRGGVPAEVVDAPTSLTSGWQGEAGASPAEPVDDVDDFDSAELGVDWATLRRPATPDWVDLASRPSHLRIHGGRSPMNRHRPSLVARRVTARRCTFETVMEFTPRNYRQLAGIGAYYNTRNWYHLHVTAEDDGTPVLGLLACDTGTVSVVPGVRTEVRDPRIGLRVTFDGPSLTFAYAVDPALAHWQAAGPVLDATTLSDEYAATKIEGEPEVWGFTGAFAGLWVQDLGAEGGYADFDSATYRTL